MRYFVNLRSATIRVQLSAAEHAQVLKHFNQTYQLRLYSGEFYSQGGGWHLAMLNEEAMPADVAARRFLDCLKVALRNGASIAESRKQHAELAAEVQTFLKSHSRRLVQVVHVKDHGRTVGLAHSHVLSALSNRGNALTDYIRDAMGIPSRDVPQPPAPAKLAQLAARFAR